MMDATVANGQLATHLSDLLKDEKVNVVETTANDDLNALFDEVTNLEQRAKEKASNATALQLSKNGSDVETRSVSDNDIAKLEPVGRDVFIGTHSVNDSSNANSSDVITNSSDANSSDVKSEPVGRDVFVGTHSIGRVQHTSESTVDLSTQTTVWPTQTTAQTTVPKQNVDDKTLIKVFKVDDDAYWYNRDNLKKHSRHEIRELSEQDALDMGMHHSKIEGPTKKTYFTQKELDERNKKNVFETTSSDNTDTSSGTTAQGTLPHTGDVPVPVPLASASMGFGAFLLAWMKKRKKKRQKRLVD